MRSASRSTMRSTNRNGSRWGISASIAARALALEATVHLERRAVHVARLARAQEERRVGDLGRRREAADRHHSLVLQARLLVEVGDQLGVDEARRKAVDGDLALADLARERAHQAD